MKHHNDHIQAKINSVQCLSPAGLHRMSYKEWGDPTNPNVLLCVHGVTRVSDDFDVLARALSDQFRIICPDVVGRGRSEWLKNPQHYLVPQYVSDMVTLIARINPGKLSYLGTSMGGLIGIGLASLSGNPIEKLILNDIGPIINGVALDRIGTYIGQPMRFPTFDEGIQYFREISESFGEHTPEQWRKLAQDVLRQDKDNTWKKHYDLNIALTMQGVTPEMALAMQKLLWEAYDKITCTTLLLRGKESDLLSADTAMQMTTRGPKPKLVEFERVGHAPTLVHDNQIAVIKEFLSKN